MNTVRTLRTLRTPSDLKLPRGIAQITCTVIRESPRPYVAQPLDPSCTANFFPLVDSPGPVAETFRSFVTEEPGFDWEVEHFAVFFLTTRRRLMAWKLVSTGTLDTLLVHPREVFADAIIARASAIVLIHNHPSGDPLPSEADIKVTRDLIRAGQLLKIEVLDHVIVASPALLEPDKRGYASLRELGYFYS